jgi:hypothetical protein
MLLPQREANRFSLTAIIGQLVEEALSPPEGGVVEPIKQM